MNMYQHQQKSQHNNQRFPSDKSKLSQRIFDARRYTNALILNQNGQNNQHQTYQFQSSSVNISNSLKKSTVEKLQQIQKQSYYKIQNEVQKQNQQTSEDNESVENKILYQNNNNIQKIIRQQKTKLQKLIQFDEVPQQVQKQQIITASSFQRTQNLNFKIGKQINGKDLTQSMNREESQIQLSRKQNLETPKPIEVKKPSRNFSSNVNQNKQDQYNYKMDERTNSVNLNSKTSMVNANAHAQFGIKQKKLTIYFLNSMLKSFLNPKKLEPSMAEEFKNYSHTLIKSLNFTSKLEPLQQHQIKDKKVTLGPLPRNVKKTLILDLDETLIHCSQNQSMQFDHIITINIADAGTTKAGLNIRPQAIEVLRELRKYFEIIIFTASHQSYAQSIISVLQKDESVKIIDHCFFRHHCVVLNNKIHIKSLQIFEDRQIENMIIVDNNLYSFAYDINNGLPIIPFYDNKKDTQMNELKEFLIKIAHKMNYNKIFKYMYSFQDYLNETKPHKLIDKMHVNYKSLNFKLFK